MPRKEFVWNPKRKKYTYKESGRALSVQQIRKLRDEFIQNQMVWSEGLAQQVASGQMSVEDWEAEMKNRIKKAANAEYLLGRGGINATTVADMATVETILEGQYAHLNDFARAVNAEALSEAQIRARSQLYFESTRQMHERGKASGWEVEGYLPCYPGDGETACRSNCKCSWEFDETRSETRAYYRLNSAEHCDDCQDRAVRYNPFVISRDGETFDD